MPSGRQSLDGNDSRGLNFDREDQAGVHRPAIQENRARPAFSLRAAFLCAREAHLPAQRVEQRCPGEDLDRPHRAVHGERDSVLGHLGHVRSRRAIAARRTRWLSARSIACRYCRPPRKSEIGGAWATKPCSTFSRASGLDSGAARTPPSSLIAEGFGPPAPYVKRGTPGPPTQ